jgi:hypothetical protein
LHEKLSKSKQGVNHPFYGKKRPEHSEFMKHAEFNNRKGKYSTSYGKKHSEQTKKKIGDKHRGKIVSKETGDKIRKKLKDFYQNQTQEQKKLKSSITSLATKGSKNPRAIKVICEQTGEIFGCLKEANVKGLTMKTIRARKVFNGFTYRLYKGEKMRLFLVSVGEMHYGLAVATNAESINKYYCEKFPNIIFDIQDITDKFSMPVMEINVTQNIKDIIK